MSDNEKIPYIIGADFSQGESETAFVKRMAEVYHQTESVVPTGAERVQEAHPLQDSVSGGGGLTDENNR